MFHIVALHIVALHIVACRCFLFRFSHVRLTSFVFVPAATVQVVPCSVFFAVSLTLRSRSSTSAASMWVGVFVFSATFRRVVVVPVCASIVSVSSGVLGCIAIQLFISSSSLRASSARICAGVCTLTENAERTFMSGSFTSIRYSESGMLGLYATVERTRGIVLWASAVRM